MFSTISLQQAQNLVIQALNEDATQMIGNIAQQTNMSEGAVTLALPKSMMVSIDGRYCESILKQLPEWGNVTTIVHSFGSIFEFKNPFPKGKVDHGYYNIMGKEGLHGHLRIDLIAHIAFVSKPFRGMESHYIGFFNTSGDCVFKVYVGRDKKRQLLAEQVLAFELLKKQYVNH